MNNTSSIRIFPGEYTYAEALELLKAEGLDLNQVKFVQPLEFDKSNPEGIKFRNIVKSGQLPTGNYWCGNGCKAIPGDDDLEFFGIREHHLNNGGCLTGFKYDGEKCKLAIFVDEPGISKQQ
jgi:hypothetical protein